MLLQGMLLGISLSFLIGPLLFAIVEAGIAQGFRAGVSVASGIWLSDVFFVVAVFYGIDAMEALVALPHFRLWAGVVGGLMLTGFGLGSLWKARQLKPIKILAEEDFSRLQARQKTYLWWFLRGFILNVINPGTIFFWLGIVTAVVVPSGWSKSEMLIFFGGMISTLIFTDILKAWAAKKLRRFLTPTHTKRMQQGIGVLMILFGMGVLIRGFL